MSSTSASASNSPSANTSNSSSASGAPAGGSNAGSGSGSKLEMKNDPRVPYGAQWLHSLGAPPSRADWYSQVKVWPTGAKDGNSSAMAAASAVAQWTSYSNKNGLVLTPEQIEGFGADYAGDEPSGMLASWMRDGLEGSKLLAVGWLNPQNPNEIRSAVAMYGNALVELNLPASAKQQQVWDDLGPDATDAEPGGWTALRGLVVGFDPNSLVFAGQDARRQMSWAFLSRYATRAWVMLDQNFVAASGMVPGGLDRTDLANQMSPLVEDWPIENGQIVNPHERDRQKRQEARQKASQEAAQKRQAAPAAKDDGSAGANAGAGAGAGSNKK